MAAAQIEQMTSLDSSSTTLAARRISDSPELCRRRENLQEGPIKTMVLP